MQNNVWKWAVILSIVAVFGSCRGGSVVTPSQTLPAPELAPSQYQGKTFYTQFALRYEKDRYRTTNYRRGLLLGINSQIEVISVDNRRARLLVKETGRTLSVENVPKHTNLTMAEAFEEMCREEPVDLSGFTAREQELIRDGRVEIGMSRAAVLAALGPPPAVGTPTRASNEWKYWSSRFTTFIVRFQNDVVVETVGRI